MNNRSIREGVSWKHETPSLYIFKELGKLFLVFWFVIILLVALMVTTLRLVTATLYDRHD